MIPRAANNNDNIFFDPRVKPLNAHIHIMPFSIGSAVNESTDWILMNNFTRTVSKNPLYTGIVISLVILAIAWIVFPTLGRPKRMLKFWIFSAIATTGLVFLHDRILLTDKEQVAADSVVANIMKGAHDPETLSDIPDVPVTFNLSENEEDSD